MVTTSPRRRRSVALVVAALLTALVAGCATATAPPPPSPPPPPTAILTPQDVGAWLDGLVPAAIERAGIAGAAVSVVRDGEVLASRGYGLAGPGTPVDPERTLFRVGSVSKVVTAVAVLQLVDRCLIDLDADVRRYLDVDLPLARGPVTMRHLLTHTAGFEERIRGLIGEAEPGSVPEPTLRDIVATDPPEQVYDPGTVPAYSNYGYGLAGHVVERVTGEPFARYVQREILDRAGTTGATFAQPLPAGAADRMSAGYPSVDSAPGAFERVRPAPAGALSASAADMGRLATALLTTSDLLSPRAWALLRSPGLDAGSLSAHAGGPRMTAGLFDESRNGREILGHGGDTRYFHSHLQLHPRERIGVFVTVNSGGRAATDTVDLRRALTEGFTDRYLPGAGGPAPAPDAGTVARAGAIAGSYESARRSHSTFVGALGLLSQTRVDARPDATLLVSPAPLDVRPAVYAEVRPGLWREVDGQRLLTVRTESAATAGDGDRVGDVIALGHDSAFTMLPTGALRDGAVAGPALAASLLVLIGALVAWPLRRSRGRRPRGDRLAHRFTHVAAACAVLALAGWAAAVTAIASVVDVPVAVLWVLVGLQWAATAGVVPAVVGVVTAVRAGSTRATVAGRVLLALALIGVAWVAVAFGLVLPDVGY